MIQAKKGNRERWQSVNLTHHKESNWPYTLLLFLLLVIQTVKPERVKAELFLWSSHWIIPTAVLIWRKCSSSSFLINLSGKSKWSRNWKHSDGFPLINNQEAMWNVSNSMGQMMLLICLRNVVFCGNRWPPTGSSFFHCADRHPPNLALIHCEAVTRNITQRQIWCGGRAMWSHMTR